LPAEYASLIGPMRLNPSSSVGEADEFFLDEGRAILLGIGQFDVE